MNPTAISVTARTLRGLLAEKLAIEEKQILIGNPGSPAAKSADGDTGKQYLNLFFFHIEHSGYPADEFCEDPFYARLHCLITAIGNDDTASNATAGENDLRLMGGVMHALHETPIMTIQSEDRQTAASLQIVPEPLSEERMNHLWSTQADTSYRLSMSYELSLAPIPFTTPMERRPRVGRLDVAAVPFGSTAPADPVLASPAEQRLETVVVDTSTPAWVPEICFVSSDAVRKLSLTIARSDWPGNVDVVVAGAPGAKVALRWEAWSADQGWTDAAAPGEIAASAAAQTLDPVNSAPIPFPVYDGLSGARQFLLHAYRTVEQPQMRSTVHIKSNPLLVSIFEDVSQ